MADGQAEPRLLIPSLKPFYDAMLPLSWLVIRVAVGWNLFVHGYGKIMIGPTDAFLKGFADLGFVPPALFWWGSLVVEMLGGICIILGRSHASPQRRPPSKCCASLSSTGATASAG
jgi:putative oxidoreductase